MIWFVIAFLLGVLSGVLAVLAFFAWIINLEWGAHNEQ